MTSLAPLTLEFFHEAATQFAESLSRTPLPELYGATDGKAVGTKVEAMFKEYLQTRFDVEVGNAASGLDFPSLDLDLKVTSMKQPQSSCPFRAATQKIYGLGYNLLVVVYVKRDEDEERAAYLDIKHVIYVDKKRTGDFTLTKQIRSIVAGIGSEVGGREAAIEDLDALLQDKNVPLDEVSRRQLAERMVDDVPAQGVLTISNALQWRLQYSRAISTAVARSIAPEVVDLRA
ncbi:restriction endonuclease [Nocardioides sp. IC4_145]|uniref:restriction endonuclease n=1 Tax=Nocardioides sp. IC4_145 TaxID=2714037 RepID=UPI0014087EB9|nr:restriction endonuclease [Nocardioides sp. IC4_145]NHC24122.1 restriction endonuclease [Nocardioides sp. IC4_145]